MREPRTRVHDPTASARWVLTCEHGGYALPRGYGTLGLSRVDLRDHIGWDVGAAAVMREAAGRLGAPAVASRYSRLLIDCNRDPDDATLIPPTSDGRTIPGNENVSPTERRRRLARYHAPYHDRIDRTVAGLRRVADGRPVRLLSVHSFTPALDGKVRRFDLGILFDDHEPLARRLGRALVSLGFRVRYNEPYSGLAGLIYSARRHGRAHGIPYVEIEVNNALIRTESRCRTLGRQIATAVRTLDGSAGRSTRTRYGPEGRSTRTRYGPEGRSTRTRRR